MVPLLVCLAGVPVCYREAMVAWRTAASILLFAVAPAGAQHVFSSRSDLLTAVDAWCTDETSAAATYGDIAGWDVSGVKDMSYLLCGYSGWQQHGCRAVKSTCNPDISGWDMSNVENTEGARLCLALGHAWRTSGARPSAAALPNAQQPPPRTPPQPVPTPRAPPAAPQGCSTAPPPSTSRSTIGTWAT